jgi:hypothetical protein
MIEFLLLVLLVGAGLVTAAVRIRSRRPLGLLMRGAAGLFGAALLLWGGASAVLLVQESRRLSADRDWRDAHEAAVVPSADVEFTDATFANTDYGPRLRARLRNRSASHTVFFLRYRWTIPYCDTPQTCRDVSRDVIARVPDGVPPGGDAAFESGLYDIPLDPRQSGLPHWPDRVQARIEVLEVRGR